MGNTDSSYIIAIEANVVTEFIQRLSLAKKVNPMTYVIWQLL